MLEKRNELYQVKKNFSPSVIFGQGPPQNFQEGLNFFLALSLLRSQLRLFETESFLISLTLFFQKGNVNKMLLRFKTYLFGFTSCHCLSF